MKGIGIIGIKMRIECKKKKKKNKTYQYIINLSNK